jgi:hypothetical protein
MDQPLIDTIGFLIFVFLCVCTYWYKLRLQKEDKNLNYRIKKYEKVLKYIVNEAPDIKKARKAVQEVYKQ